MPAATTEHSSGSTASSPQCRKGNCLDNAPMESFFGSLKTELVHRTRFGTRAEAKAAL
jgi:putative transposase